MEKTVLRDYQVQAVDAALKAIKNNSKRVVLSMAAGTGIINVLLVLVEQFVQEHKKILILSNRTEEKENVIRRLRDKGMLLSLRDMDDGFIAVATYQWARIHKEEVNVKKYQYIFCLHAEECTATDAGLGEADTVFVGFVSGKEYGRKNLFSIEDCMFQYSFEDAVRSGYLTSMHDPSVYGPVLEEFCSRVFEQFGYIRGKYDYISKSKVDIDFCFLTDDKKVWVECKSYRSRYVSPQAIEVATSRLSEFGYHQNVSHNDILLLIVFGEVPEIDKENAYTKRNVLIWDIANLMYYCQSDRQLLDQLSRLTYFPIAGITALPSPKWKFKPVNKLGESASDVQAEAESLKRRLKSCGTGRKGFVEYEEICKDILDFLFKGAFSEIFPQRRTEDKHFRMDFIAPLKGNNEKTHSFWQMLTYHYNSHFVVFECKNYEEEIDQNLIYITEKYLFNAALRNVAFILSRKGFSEPAHFAACGCLKEHGKLILDIKDADLVEMLDAKAKGDEPADHLLKLLEKFLMGISK